MSFLKCKRAFRKLLMAWIHKEVSNYQKKLLLSPMFHDKYYYKQFQNKLYEWIHLKRTFYSFHAKIILQNLL